MDGDATHVDEGAGSRLRVPLDGPEPDHADDSDPLWTAIGVGVLNALAITTWFLILAMAHAGTWTAAEVTAPLWGTALAGGVAALVLGVACGVLDARDAHSRGAQVVTHRKLLCLDFDGVLHGYQSGWQGAYVVSDPPVPGAIEALQGYLQHFRVAIHSSRSGQLGGIQAMRPWLHKHLMEALGAVAGSRVFDLVEWPTSKPPAFVTIDDQAIQFRARGRRLTTSRPSSHGTSSRRSTRTISIWSKPWSKPSARRAA